MRTLLVTLLMLLRFGPDLVYATSVSLTQPSSSHQTTAPKRFVSPPAAEIIHPVPR
jgi:hypothetical protein